jgi:hypothetical protein
MQPIDGRLTTHPEYAMLRYSLRQFLVATGALCVAIALTQLAFVPSCMCLVGIVVVLNLLVVPRAWRCIAYGAVAGISGGIALMLFYMLIVRGRLSASNYQESSEIRDIIYAWRPYVVHLGAYVGAITALAVCGKRLVAQDELVSSPNTAQQSIGDQ